MVDLFGQTWTRAELLRQVGSLAQLADVTLLEAADGPGRGTRVARVRAGGLTYDVLLDRGGDIGQVDVAGRPVAFWSNVGLVAPTYREMHGAGFLRSFAGGLVTTCGLDHAFDPEDEPATPDRPARHFPQHGRLSNTPAFVRGYGASWDGDDCVLFVDAEVRQAAMYGETLVLRRRVSTRLGTRRIELADSVTNEGHAPAEHMYVYHCNFGFPAVGPGARVEAVSPVEHVSGTPLPDRLPAPSSTATSTVEERRVAATGEPAAVRLVSPEGEVTEVQWSGGTLPYLILWQLFADGNYVLGIEPSTNRTAGRAAARAAGELRRLEPGESVDYRLVVDFG